MASQFDSFAPAEFQTSKWKVRLTWSALIILGILIYELTTQPILGVIVVCSKFGWNDLLIAYLLRKVDPNQARSRAVSWFCIAAGLGNMMFASTFLGVILFLLMGLVGPGGFQAVVAPGISAFGMVFLCHLLITLANSRGVYLATQSQTKVWLMVPSWSVRGKEENLAGVMVKLGYLPLCFLSLLVILLCGGLLNPQGILA